MATRQVILSPRYSGTVSTKFYEFRQNNSGGSFDFDHTRGVSVHVIIEATSKDDAVHRAGNIGLYFDGSGDCDCCGDRWSEPWTDDSTDVPSIYGTPLSECDFQAKWSGEDPMAYVHYLDGSIEGWK